MKIISHCGLWDEKAPKNSRTALESAICHGFGIETDFRDQDGRLVIAHHPPLESEGLSLLDLLEMLSKVSLPGMSLALNVKAMHLSEWVKNVFPAKANAFCFDMSVPDLRNYIRDEIPVYTRQSEYEKEPSFYSEAKGVWLDAFDSVWYSRDLIWSHLRSGKDVCLVSPELHGREPHELWNFLQEDKELVSHPHLALCTDRSWEARELFS